MFYDLIHTSCLTSSKEASLKAVKLSQSKMRYPNLWCLPVLIDVKCSQVGQANIPTVFSRVCNVQTSIFFKPGVLKLSSFTSPTKGTEGNGIHLTLNPLPDEAKRDKKMGCCSTVVIWKPHYGKVLPKPKKLSAPFKTNFLCGISRKINVSQDSRTF